MAETGMLHTSMEVGKSKGDKPSSGEKVIAEDVKEEATRNPKNSNGNRILLAEDEKPLSRVLSLKLAKAGYVVDTAFNGEEALDMVSKNSYDLLLLDLVMPKVGGFEVLEEMKKQNIELKTIILSNLSQNEDKAKAKDLGAIDFFTKSDTPIIKIVEVVKGVLK